MAKLNYDFEPRHRPKRPADQWTRRMRLIILFCAVAAVTAAIIYVIMPEKKVPVVHPPVTPEVSPQPQAQTAGTDDNKEIPEKITAPEDAAPAVPDNISVPETAPRNTESEKNSPQHINTADIPDKGVVTPYDPAPADDQPQYSGSVDANALKELAGLLDRKDYQNLFARANSLINAAANNSAARSGYGKILTSGRKNIWNSGNWKEFTIVHKVVSGDNLSAIAHRNHTTVSMLKKVNRLKNSNIMIGQPLRIIPGPWQLTISKTSRLMTLSRKDEIYAVFPIGIGRKNSTPTGKFVICHRRLHPDYRDAQGRVFKYGDEKNPLGTVFLALALPDKPDKPFRGYGIHGTSDNKTVGRSLSNGCVRMHNDDVIILYHLLPTGTPVEITE
ncbi:MAG: L,D-transpeptidase family protein [Lentisphaeria bacterium]|nr:L,D-transpeptidase family protein [Lentisphaeria bacterium]